MKLYSVTEVLGKYIDWSAIPDQILADACTRGTIVHSACANWAAGGYALPLADEYAGYYTSFANWFDAYVAKVVLVEKRITCEALGFTGQPDFVFELKTGELALIDIKTPAPLSKTWVCQLSAYDYLLKQDGIKVDTLMSLRLRRDGKAALGKRYDNERAAAFNVFLSALNAHRSLV